MQREPFAAHLYFIPRALRRPQAALVRLLRRYFQGAPGWVLPATAEIIEDPERKRAIIDAHVFFPPAPFVLVHAVLCTILRPLLVFLLRRWVGPRPIVLIRPDAYGGSD